jgi:WD40 repeat protein
MLVSGALDRTVCLWDVNTQQLRHAFLHDDGVIKIHCHPTQPIVYSCSVDRSVAVWDMRSCQLVKRFTGHRDIVLDFALFEYVESLIGALATHCKHCTAPLWLDINARFLAMCC